MELTKTYLKFNFVCILILSNIYSSAQLPELAFGKRNIENEINSVQAQLKNKPNQSFYLLNLARNYYQLDNYLEAEKYFLQVIQQPICSPLDFKALAVSLKYNGNDQLAEEFYKIYIERTGVSTFSNLWESNKTISTGQELKRIHEKTIVYGNAKADGSIQLSDKGICRSSVYDAAAYTNANPLNFPKVALEQVGNYTQAGNPNAFYFSKRKENNTFGIFYVERKKNKWSKAKELTFEDIDANYAFPLFVNGLLYFSSDRSGGNGFYDIYEANVKKHKVTSVQNLGKDVNTDKNEICPSIINGSFAFSSNGYPGRGGYDVYTTDWTFHSVSVLPTGFNSRLNDFTVLPSPSNQTIVVRGNGFDVGIYSDTAPKPKGENSDKNGVTETVDSAITESKAGYYLTGNVLSVNAEPIKDVRVLFAKSYVDQGHFQSSQNDGSFGINLPGQTHTWLVEAYKPGYELTHFELDIRTLNDKPLIIVLNEVKTYVKADEPVYPREEDIRKTDPHPAPAQEPKPYVPTTATHPTTPNKENVDPPISLGNTSNYYIIYGSSPTLSVAESYYDKWLPKLPNIEIIKSEKKGTYRVGTYAGTTHSEAMKEYYAAKKYANVWILRPEVQ